jgi:hypothetical protein
MAPAAESILWNRRFIPFRDFHGLGLEAVAFAFIRHLDGVYPRIRLVLLPQDRAPIR